MRQRMMVFCLGLTLISTSVWAYSGGSGTSDDPYQIGTAEDLMFLGDEPNDWDKHFILVDHIDLDPNLPGGRVFQRAVIAPDLDYTYANWDFQGTTFSGTFNGNGFEISNLTISETGQYQGLFGYIDRGATIKALGLNNVTISKGRKYTGGLAGKCSGCVFDCYSDGVIKGSDDTGGLVGFLSYGSLFNCSSSGSVSGSWHVGGLVGYTSQACIASSYSSTQVSGRDYIGGLVGTTGGISSVVFTSYSAGVVDGDEEVGGLVGRNYGSIANCYSSAVVSGNTQVGGLVGFNWKGISNSYSVGAVSGNSDVGGLVGDAVDEAKVSNCFWDKQTSLRYSSDGGKALSTSSMQQLSTYTSAGWDVLGESVNGTCSFWQVDEGAYPVLRCFEETMPEELLGQGTSASPYQINNAEDLGAVWLRPLSCYRLTADIDLSGVSWRTSVIPWFAGVLDGDGHTIRHLTMNGINHLGLFGALGQKAQVEDLGLESVSIRGSRSFLGALVADNHGRISRCFGSGSITGDDFVGMLVARNLYGVMSNCYSTGSIKADSYVGGLVGHSRRGEISNCYGITTVDARLRVGGLIGYNEEGTVYNSYSAGWIDGESYCGGLIGHDTGFVTASFWDMEASAWDTSAAGVGLTTAEMMDPNMIAINGLGNDPNWVLDEYQDYPRLVWQGTAGTIISERLLDWIDGFGTTADPYQLINGDQLAYISEKGSGLWRSHIVLAGDLDLTGITWEHAVIPTFAGHLDGRGYVMHNLMIRGQDYTGLFGRVQAGAIVTDLGLESTDVEGRGDYVGSLAGDNHGLISNCYGTGCVTGKKTKTGGLVGENFGDVIQCYSTQTVTGRDDEVGGLVGRNHGYVSYCYSSGSVVGYGWDTGGLVGDNEDGTVFRCYSMGRVDGGTASGGLVGGHYEGSVIESFWNLDTSGQMYSTGGMGLVTADLMNPELLGLNGWAGGASWILEPNQDYPRLSWEDSDAVSIPEPQLDWIEGDGTVENPFVVRQADQLSLIGKASNLWSCHFELANDVEMDQSIWYRAVIPQFTGRFNGCGFSIRHLHVSHRYYAGFMGQLEAGGEVTHLGVESATMDGYYYSGILVGKNSGLITNCHSGGSVTGSHTLGGLVGTNEGEILSSYSDCTVSGTSGHTGGLVGVNLGLVSSCYSTGTVESSSATGGLVGWNSARIMNCYSSVNVNGSTVGGCVGTNREGTVTRCYSVGLVSGGSGAGGFIADNEGEIVDCLWDIETSEWTTSDGGEGLATLALMDPEVLGLKGWANDANWVLDPYQDYPRLAWQGTAGEVIPPPQLEWIEGRGTVSDPFQIEHIDQLVKVNNISQLWQSHFILTQDLDMSGVTWTGPVLGSFSGSFNGEGHCLSGFQLEYSDVAGFIGVLEAGGEVTGLGLEDVDVKGGRVGALAGINEGSVVDCYSTGRVSAPETYSSGMGGLIGQNEGTVLRCYSTASVSGRTMVGGLIGINSQTVSHCYSQGDVTGMTHVGGLIGIIFEGEVSLCYSTSQVTMTSDSDYYVDTVGGFAGVNYIVPFGCLWDVETSGQSQGQGCIGLTTTQMMDPNILGLNGWAQDPNWILDPHQDYPRLVWQGTAGAMIAALDLDWIDGAGTLGDPYVIVDVNQLEFLGRAASGLWKSCFVLANDLDASGLTWQQAVIPAFWGRFDGAGYCIDNLTILGGDDLGLFGCIMEGASILNLGLHGLNVQGESDVGGLAGESGGSISGCFTTGTIQCVSDGGGLVGMQWGDITNSYSHADVWSSYYAAGLVGRNDGSLTMCYSCGWVQADWGIYGLTNASGEGVMACFWDVERSGTSTSSIGTGLTTVEMQGTSCYVDSGWDFVGESDNGQDDLWQMSLETGYPMLTIFSHESMESLPGEGTSSSPYLIASPEDLMAVVHYASPSYFKLVEDLDFSGIVRSVAVIPNFNGHLDGNGHVIDNLTIQGDSDLGLVGWLQPAGVIRNLTVTHAWVSGEDQVGLLVGTNEGTVQVCRVQGTVMGDQSVGGVVGLNATGEIQRCVSDGVAWGNTYVGGLVGWNEGGTLAQSYNTAFVTGSSEVGGAVGRHAQGGTLRHCYSVGLVAGNSYLGGLVGRQVQANAPEACLWDTQVSGMAESDGGIGLTTGDMQYIHTYLGFGWDFVDESDNGTEDIWMMPEEPGYPVLRQE